MTPRRSTPPARTRGRTTAAIVAVTALALAACGSDDNDDIEQEVPTSGTDFGVPTPVYNSTVSGNDTPLEAPETTP